MANSSINASNHAIFNVNNALTVIKFKIIFFVPVLGLFVLNDLISVY